MRAFDGVTEVIFPIPIVDDGAVESAERFTISLVTDDPLVVLGPDSTIVIADNDGEYIVDIIICYSKTAI